VLEALEAGEPIDKLLVQRELKGDFFDKVIALAKQRTILIQSVPKEKLNRLIRGNHQGVIAALSFIHYYKLEDVLPQVYDKGETPLFLLLDEITDVRNFGAIARSAVCFGAHGLITTLKGSARIDAVAMKAAAGALSHISVCREKSLQAAIDFFELNGVQLIACDVKGEQYIYEADLRVPTAIIFGSEGKGINPKYLKQVNKKVKIPMAGVLNSFNVSVSAGIVLYEVWKQRQLTVDS